ncbi:MAG: STAS domain-containing protein [Gammaproteobacteria bacterium]|nr:STAS domain-containing protein [Gammaproteobacteria bacterium]
MAIEIQGFSDITAAIDLYRITPKEIKLIQQYGKSVLKTKLLKQFIEDFYKWLPNVPEFKNLFSRPGLIEHVKKKQTLYWEELFQCELNAVYLQSRYKVGNIHAKINLPLSSYVAGMNFSAEWWVLQISKTNKDVKEAAKLSVALNKLFSLDVALVSSSYTQSSNDLIEQQSRALMELSTPTIQLWEGILVLPILGVLDSKRTQDMTNMMLAKIQQTNARWIIIDITGVPTVDSSVANHLIKVTKVTKLMGCECLLSGIGPEVAQTLVQLGVNLEMIETASNLKSAFQGVLVRSGYHIKLKAGAASS